MKRLAIWQLGLVALLFLSGALAPAYGQWTLDDSWGLPDPQPLSAPEGVAIDPNTDNVYVADRGNGRIMKYTRGGAFIAEWVNPGSGAGQFNDPIGVAVDRATGDVYVSDKSNARILKFDSNGNFLLEWGSLGSGNGQFNTPKGLAVDGAGNVYVADHFNHRVQKFDSSGAFLSAWGSQGGANGEFNRPNFIAINTAGEVYVTDVLNNRVQKFDDSGAFLGQWGSLGSGPGQFNSPVGIAVNDAGEVYVADRLNNRVQKFNGNGTSVLQIWNDGGGLDGPRGLAVNALNRVFVADTGNDRIQKYNSNTNQTVARWGHFAPKGVFVDGAGAVYVAATGSDRVVKLASDGSLLLDWGTTGSGNGNFNGPEDIAVDDAGNIYVADTGNDRVQKFASDGSFLLEWGTAGSGDGQFSAPSGIAVGGGYIYVADSGNGRVQRFDADGAFRGNWDTPADKVAVDGSGNVFVAHIDGVKIYRGDNGPLGTLINEWSSPNTASLAVSQGGSVYVVNFNNDKLKRYSGEGVLGTTWDQAGIGLLDVAVDDAGYIYATDPDNGLLHKIDLGGTYTLTSPSGDIIAAAGESVAINLSCGVNYTSCRMLVDGVVVLSVGKNQTDAYTIENIQSDHVISFDSTLDQGFLYPGVATNGSISSGPVAWINSGCCGILNFSVNVASGLRSATVGVSATGGSTGGGSLNITADPGYLISQISIAQNGSSQAEGLFHPTSNNRSFNYFTENSYWASRTVSAIFVLETFTLTASAGANGSISPAGDTVVDHGTNQTYTITPDPGYHIDDVLVDGVSVGAVSSYTFTDVQTDHTIDALFVAGNLTVSLPDLTAGYNQALVVPVSLNQADGVLASEFFVEYDTALLTFDQVVTTGTLTDGWSVQSNVELGAGSLATLKIAAATNQSSASGAVVLFNLHFILNDVRVPASTALRPTHVLLNNDPPNQIENGSVVLVGNDGSLLVSPELIRPAESVTITVVDLDGDLDGSPGSDQLSVEVVNGNSGDSVVLVLNEDAASAGTFTGTLDTEYGAAAINDGIIQLQVGDELTATYSDALDATGNGPSDRSGQVLAYGTDGALSTTIVVQPGDAIYLRVTDEDLNLLLDVQESVVISALSSSGEIENNIVLSEDGTNSDVFFGQIATAGGSGSDNDGILQISKGQFITFTYVDAVTALGDQANRTNATQGVDPFGDADGNGAIGAFDATQVLQHVLSPFLSGVDSLSANLDLFAFDPANGRISPFDAALILQQRVGLLDVFPVRTPEADNHPQPETDQSDNSAPKFIADERLLSLRSAGDYIAIWAEERADIVSGELFVEAIDGAVQMAPELSGDFIVAAQRENEGLRIVFAGAQSVSGAGELLRIYPGVGPDRATLTRADFNDGRIVGRVSERTQALGLPARVVLYGNQPNPFNPETSIAFELPQAAQVRLEVFDALGQKVKTLWAGMQSAGSHQLRWNGRDERGVQVGSGVYLYRLQADKFVQMRRMLLLK